MGLATGINAATTLLYEELGWGGDSLLNLLWAFWWFDTALSMVVCIVMLHVVSTRHSHTLETVTATILLPFVSPIVAAALGAVLTSALAPTHADRAALTLLVSYATLGMVLPIAMMILGIYTARLVIHGAPPRGALTSVVLPLGPLGTGGLAFVTLGQMSRTVLQPLSGMSASSQSILSFNMIGDMLYSFGVLIALIMWGFGLVWLGLALFTFADAILRSQGPRFGMPWWGLTFPLGVYGLLTFSLGTALAPTPFAAFLDAAGTGLTGLVFLMWMYVGARTLHLGIEGSMFDAPCLVRAEELPLLAADGPGTSDAMELEDLADTSSTRASNREAK